MAYTSATLNCITPRMGTAPAQWVYTTTDAHGTAADGSTGYFTDGADKGVVANDILTIVDTDTFTCTVHMFKSATVAAAATLS